MIGNRAYLLNTKPTQKGAVLYWMDRDMRINHNWALIHAQEIATAQNQPLIIAYNLVSNFLNGSARQWIFKIKALQEIEEACGKKNIPFYCIHDTTGENSPQLLIEFIRTHKIGTVVTDFSPLRIQRNWKKNVAEAIECPLIEVDAHNIVPARIVSEKQEYGAYTLRPKLYKLLPNYLDSFPDIKTQSTTHTPPAIDWSALLSHADIPQDTTEVTWAQPGSRHAESILEDFIRTRLVRYATERNDPLAEAQSDLSPYLHYGMIGAQHIALSIMEATETPIEKLIDKHENKASVEENATLSLSDNAGAFLEELIVRKELADNFCLYNDNYDTTLGFPAWAQKSHAVHRKDAREYIYAREEFEKGLTHDPLWNACQQEMVTTGKMHGYMRMYWAKKILEWTATPEDALATAIYLNDKYELDGRDPNGYAGIAWSIGGVHDRAWFTRPIFGQIRYMARSGCDKKFDTNAYIKKYLAPSLC